MKFAVQILKRMQNCWDDQAAYARVPVQKVQTGAHHHVMAIWMQRGDRDNYGNELGGEFDSSLGP